MGKTLKLIGFLLAMIVVAFLTLGCSGTKITTTSELPQNLDELSLTEMWGAVVKTIDIQESDNANLQSMSLRILNGKLQQLSFEFYVLAELEWTMYSISFDEKGKLHWDSGHSKGGDNIPLTVNPKIVFTQIDRFGLTNIRTDVSGFTIEVMAQAGVEYTSDKLFSLYHLKDGVLTPLEHVKLSSDNPGLPIKVGSIARSEPPKGNFETYMLPEYWFLSEDVNRAEIVEYLDDEQESGYNDFISEILNALPAGWEMKVVDQKGAMEPPHGLNEPLFRIDFVDPTHQFAHVPDYLVHPSLRLYFYDIKEKDSILATIEAEKLYSWDIPDYFDETTGYIIVTSPLYINDGCFSDEARELYQPLENTLKDYFN